MRSNCICALILCLLISTCNSSDLITCGTSLLDVNTIKHDEGQSISIRILDSEQKLLSPMLQNAGTFMSLCRQNKFLLIDNGVHYAAGPSFLISANGEIIKRFHFGLLAVIGKSENEKLFWTQSYDATEQGAITLLNIYNSDGNSVFQGKFNEEQSYPITIDGTKYYIPINAPNYPG